MRLKTEIIIAAELKHAQSLGLFATIIKKGDENAGQIYILVNKNNSEFILIGPPFGTSFNHDGQKLWSYPLGQAPLSQLEIDDYLNKIRNFDPDIYILEIEDKTLKYKPQGVFVIDEKGVFTVNDEDDAAKAARQAEAIFKK